MLEVEDLGVRYGAIEALRGASISVQGGRTTAVIGSNGAGKTTLVRALLGLVKPHTGRIAFEGRDVSSLSVVQRVRLGLMLVPEGRGLIGGLTVEENLLLGGYTRREPLGPDLRLVYETFPTIERLKGRPARLLSGGELQMLAIGRALTARPRLLILDEPSMGLSPVAVDRVFAALRQLKSEGMTLLLVEQNAAMAFEIADSVYVLELGKNVVQGTPRELLMDDEVRRAYLGV